MLKNYINHSNSKLASGFVGHLKSLEWLDRLNLALKTNAMSPNTLAMAVQNT